MLASLSDLLLKLMGKRHAGSPSALTNPAMGPCQARRLVQARLRTTLGGYARLRMHMLRLAALLFLMLAAPAAARPGELDRSFAGGRVTLTRTHDQGVGAGVSVRGSAVLGPGCWETACCWHACRRRGVPRPERGSRWAFLP